MRDDLIIRPATPEDTEEAVPLIYSSGPAMFDFAFTDEKNAAQDFLRWSFRRGKSLFGYGIHRLAVLNGRVVGCYGSYTTQQAQRLGHKVIPEILRHYGVIAGVRTLWRGFKVEQSLPPPLEGRLYICHVGVSEEHRRQGIGAVLIQDAMEQSRQSTPLVPALDVATGNSIARHLYERMGFVIQAERPSPLPGLPSHFYMEHRLSTGES
jgi:ribosomal protein S18 acetylase RimI-like enzyme